MWRLARGGVTPTHRRRILTATRAMAATVPLLLLHEAGADHAVRAVEALRGHLTGAMHAPRLPPGIVDPDLESAYRRAAATYEATQARAREGIAGYGDAAPAAAALAAAVEHVRAHPDLAGFGGAPQIDDLRACLPRGAAGIYLIPGSDQASTAGTKGWPGAAIVLRADDDTTHVNLPDLTAAAATDQANALLSGTGAAQAVCAWLWKAVITPLRDGAGQVLTGASPWVFIPTGYLALLPLHAAGSTATGWIDDHVTVRVSPSLMALADTGQSPAATGEPVAAISDAVDLRFLAADRAAATTLLDTAVTVEPVTPDTVLTALIEAPVAVISGHAAHSLTEGGGLALGQTPTNPADPTTRTQTRWLSAEAVERLPLRARELAFLSACSSGQIAVDLPDEAIGLPSAFRHAGFRSVIATTWPVKDHIAFLTLARYLQLRAANPDHEPAQLLQQTRTWLRTTTATNLDTWLTDLTTTVDLPADTLTLLRQWWTDTPDTHPCSDPADWAAYTLTGH